MHIGWGGSIEIYNDCNLNNMSSSNLGKKNCYEKPNGIQLESEEA